MPNLVNAWCLQDLSYVETNTKTRTSLVSSLDSIKYRHSQKLTQGCFAFTKHIFKKCDKNKSVENVLPISAALHFSFLLSAAKSENNTLRFFCSLVLTSSSFETNFGSFLGCSVLFRPELSFLMFLTCWCCPATPLINWFRACHRNMSQMFKKNSKIFKSAHASGF